MMKFKKTKKTRNIAKFSTTFFGTKKSFASLLCRQYTSDGKSPIQSPDYERPLIVIALGGNALLQRGEKLTSENQRKNIQIACQKIAEIVPLADIVLTHGNGPQVGLLAIQSSQGDFPTPLDVIGAESVGMIGYLMEQEFRNVIPGKDVVTIVTQVEVDAQDEAFKKPTKPIGRRYTKSEVSSLKNDWKWAVDEAIVKGQNEEMYRRVVASPQPKKILEINAIKKLVEADSVVIACGGGGIPVIKNQDGSVHGIEAVIDKDKATSLLATSLKATALIMLTDVENVFLDWKDPVKRRALRDVTPEEISKHSFSDGSMGPKVEAAVDFVTNGGKWAAIGALHQLPEIIAGVAGTKVIESAPSKEKTFAPYNIGHLPNTWPPKWAPDQVYAWLTDVIEFPEFYIGVFRQAGLLDNPEKLLSLHLSEVEKMGVPWSIAQALCEHIQMIRKHIDEGGKDEDYGLRYVPASPYPWPFNGKLDRENTCLVIIDMQEDFVGYEGYVAKMGYSVDMLRAPIPFIQNLLAIARKKGIHVIHTREGHRDNFVDLPENKRWRTERLHAGIGSPGGFQILTRGKKGWDIVPEVYPIEGETIIDKPGKGSFVATDLDLILKLRGVQNLIMTGVTTDVCVHTTMREANDRGFECLLVEDGCAAANRSNHKAAISMVHMSGGIFGATATTAKVIAALNKLPDFN